MGWKRKDSCGRRRAPGGPRHRVAIHPERQRALRASLAQSSHGAERESPLFLAVPRGERRKALTRRQVSKLFHRYAREAGLPLGVTPHRARATFIAEALDRKCPMEAVQASQRSQALPCVIRGYRRKWKKSDASMAMPMMRVRKVVMEMSQRLMAVWVKMLGVGRHLLVMRVLVVGIVDMLVLMFHRLVRV